MIAQIDKMIGFESFYLQRKYMTGSSRCCILFCKCDSIVTHHKAPWDDKTVQLVVCVHSVSVDISKKKKKRQFYLLFMKT